MTRWPGFPRSSTGRAVEYVLYPDEGHGFTHREHRVDAIERTVRFFVRAL